MKKFILLTLVLIFAAAVPVAAQMTDQQVADYITESLASGKNQNQISLELMAKGVTAEQIERLTVKYGNKENEIGIGETVEASNLRAESTAVETFFSTADQEVFASAESTATSRIYGHSIFSGHNLTFEPNENAATPADYRLGPGDQVIIEIWGYNEASITQTISPEGKINVSQVGPIQLSGLTITEASAKIKKALSAKYSGIGGERPNSEVSITLGRIRTIQVNIMGAVAVPGTYRLSSFATVFTALHRAGGVKEEGTMRAIKVVRGGEDYAVIDVYGYLFDGRSDSDIRLQEGDVIMVPPYQNLVEVQGAVKRPMIYELAQGETVGDAVRFAGGFISEAYKESVTVDRKSASERQILTVSAANIQNTPAEDGDIVSVAENYQKYSNRLEVQGFVFRPGLYEFGSDINTVKSLVEAAGGLREDAFLPRAIITREKIDLTTETISVPLGDIMLGKAPDVALAKNDVLMVSGTYELSQRGTMIINGMVANPGTFPFADNTSVEDLIIMAGGLLDGASTSRVEVARRVADMAGLNPTDTIGRTFHFSIKDGLALDGADEFILEPYDVVSVRQSPAYQTQKFVSITGEVAFPGSYVIQDRGETMSDIIHRAGGPTGRAYLKGGVVVRQTNEEEQTLNSATRRMLRMDNDEAEIDADKLSFSEHYTVGVQMEKALSQPHSQYDIVLREGDQIVVPEYLNTVRIQGDVMYPNVVQYVPGKGLEYYINSAGGYSQNSKRSKVYIVMMNGNVTKAHMTTKIEPGCEIIVPSKKAKEERMQPAEILSLGTSTASLATMIATLVRLFK